MTNMSFYRNWETLEEGGQKHRVYVAHPERREEKLPIVIVLQEIWGVDGHIRDVTERFAKAGYLAVAPDLFAEDGEPQELLSEERIARARAFLHQAPPQAFRDPEVRAEALRQLPPDEQRFIGPSVYALLGSFARQAKMLQNLQSCFHALLRDERGNGRIASVGYCMGGAFSASLASTVPELAGAVVYYGRLYGDSATGIQCPVLGFFGGLDEGINSLIPRFAEAMQAQGKSFTYRVYDGVKHAFFNDTGAGYDINAARDAWVRTLSFLDEVLQETRI